MLRATCCGPGPVSSSHAPQHPRPALPAPAAPPAHAHRRSAGHLAKTCSARARPRPVACAPPLLPTVASSSTDARPSLDVDLSFDNASPSGTLVTLVGEDRDGMLAAVLAAFATLSVHVVEASVRTSPSGVVQDTFLVRGADGERLKSEDLPLIKEHVLTSLRYGSSKSGQPLIYGVSAALEVAALRLKRSTNSAPPSDSAALSLSRTDVRASSMALEDAQALELAAAEMAVAASALVAAEKALDAAAALALSQPATSRDALAAAEAELDVLERTREEAASQLERRMAAMEAAIASRRSPKESVAEVLRAQMTRELLGDAAAEGPAVGTGPGVGNGTEIILQAFNWDAHSVGRTGTRNSRV